MFIYLNFIQISCFLYIYPTVIKIIILSRPLLRWPGASIILEWDAHISCVLKRNAQFHKHKSDTSKKDDKFELQLLIMDMKWIWKISNNKISSFNAVKSEFYNFPDMSMVLFIIPRRGSFNYANIFNRKFTWTVWCVRQHQPNHTKRLSANSIRRVIISGDRWFIVASETHIYNP